nr:hypothetical protein [Bradyrhizobium macuxiense]
MRHQGVVETPELEQDVAAAEPCLDQIGPECQRLVVSGEGFLIAPQARKEMTEPWRSHARLERQRPLVGGKGLAMTLQLDERMTAAKPRLSQVRPQCECLVISGKGFIMTPEIGQQMTEPWPGEAGLERQCPVIGGKRFVVAPEPGQCIAAAEPRLGQIRLERHSLGKQRFGLQRLPAIHRPCGILKCSRGGTHAVHPGPCWLV